MSQHIDHILKEWPYDVERGGVRFVQGDDGRELLQMRIDLGVLQLEYKGRPDGVKPNGFATYCDYLVSESLHSEDAKAFRFSDEQCLEADREFVQFYHRRICWLQLSRYAEAVKDADHTLRLMDVCASHSPDERWTLSHEQYRPFVMYHRTQAAALAALDASGAEAAVEEMNNGLESLKILFEQFEVEEQFEDNDLVVQLTRMREQLRDEYEVGRTLEEQLRDAVASEQYELAAQIRDKLDKHDGRR